jgi:GNAT superfamily N-acetyltransferase
MTLEPLSGDLRAFAEDPGAFVAIGPDEERILTNRYSVTFTPGVHFWSASVQRLRFGVDDVAAQVTEIRGLVADRGRNAAAWTVGPSATPDGLLELLVAMGMRSESDEGSLILVLTAPPQAPSPFEVRLVTSYEDHVAAIEVANQGFAFPSEDAVDERRRARASFQSERAGGHSVRLLAVDGGRPVAVGRVWFSPLGLYLGGGATIPSERRRGAMSALVARAWEEAVDRGTPTLVTLGGAMAAAGLQRIGFRAVGRVWHLVDRIHG